MKTLSALKSIFINASLFAINLSFSCALPGKKELHLHFDVNKTIIAMDAVQGKGLEETINGILAEFTFEAWNGKTEQSYYGYVTDKLAEENPHISRADELFKSKRNELLKQFPTFLKQHPRLLAQYEQDKTKMLQVLGEKEMVIFPSFFKLIQWLQDNHTNQFALYLRTFGKDLPEVVPAIEDQVRIKFAAQGEFHGKALHIGSQINPFMAFFKNPDLKHYAIRDDYAQWKSNGFQAVGGKPFPIDAHNPMVLSMMFDDNANDPDKPIIQPLGTNGQLQDTQELLKKGNIVAVNPKEAILNENYFIEKVAKMMAQ